MNSPRLMPLNSSSSETSVDAGCSETFGIRGNGTLDQLSACRQPCERCCPTSGASSRVVCQSTNMPSRTRCQRSAFTPSSSKPVVARPPGCVRSPTRLTIVAPKRSLPASAALRKLVPAMFASQPSERSSSVEWPTDSWMARNSCDGIDDDVVAAGGDRFGLQLLDHLVAGLFGVLQPRVVLDVLVADQLRAIDDGARLEVAAGAVGGGGA